MNETSPRLHQNFLTISNFVFRNPDAAIIIEKSAGSSLIICPISEVRPLYNQDHNAQVILNAINKGELNLYDFKEIRYKVLAIRNDLWWHCPTYYPVKSLILEGTKVLVMKLYHHGFRYIDAFTTLGEYYNKNIKLEILASINHQKSSRRTLSKITYRRGISRALNELEHLNLIKWQKRREVELTYTGCQMRQAILEANDEIVIRLMPRLKAMFARDRARDRWRIRARYGPIRRP